MNFFAYSLLVMVTSLVIVARINGEENEWLTLSKNAQNSIKDSIAKIKSYGASEEKVKSVIDSAFDDFVKFVKNGVSPILEKLKAPSAGNTRIRTKLNGWVEGLERANAAAASDGAAKKSSAQKSYEKFENTVEAMVNNAPKFAEKIKAASPEHREVLSGIGSFMKTVIGRLVDNVKGAVGRLAAADDAKPADQGRLQNAKKPAQTKIKQ